MVRTPGFQPGDGGFDSPRGQMDCYEYEEYEEREYETNRSRKIEKRRHYRVSGWPSKKKFSCGTSPVVRKSILVRRAEQEKVVKVFNEKKLLFSVTKKDFEFQTFRAGGKGGQHQNKRDTGVRCVHKASGASGEGRDSRSQKQNKRNAFERCVHSDDFQKWLRVEAARKMGEEVDIEKKVKDWMQPENIKIEYF